MKKFVLVALVLASTPFLSSAQHTHAAPKANQKATGEMKHDMDMSMMDSPTAKGQWLLGLSLTAASATDDDGVNEQKQSWMGFQPEFGYFFMDNMSLGLSVGLGSAQSKIDGTTEQKFSTFFAAPTFRYYLPISNKFQFLARFQVPVGSYKTTVQNGADVDLKSTAFGVQVMPAFAFFPSNKISIEMGLGSIYFNSVKTEDEKNSVFGISTFNDNDLATNVGHGFFTSPTFGVKFYFGK